MLSFFSNVSITLLANSIPPSPPFSHTFAKANSQPLSSQNFFTNAYSASVSVTNELSVTTIGTLYCCKFSICFSRLTIPFSRASKFSLLSSVLGTPPLYFNALTVATNTTASGFNPDILHLISKNFSAPKSAPKPASVTTISAILSAVFVALTELQP